jgi:hypothetical protein
VSNKGSRPLPSAGGSARKVRLSQTANACFPRCLSHDEGMPSDRDSIKALKNLVSETDFTPVHNGPLPENRTPRCRELLHGALALTDDLISQSRMPAPPPWGIGGSETARKYGSEYFRQLATHRKTRAGGRPLRTPKWSNFTHSRRTFSPARLSRSANTPSLRLVSPPFPTFWVA